MDGSIQWRVPTWYPHLKQHHTQLKKLFDELIRYNQALNLISARTLPVADAIHFADSILGSELILSKNPAIKEIYDLGSGNGFPGIIFGLLNPGIQVKLVDSDVRKCEYLKATSHLLGLSNVTVINKSVEALSEGSVQFCLSRGFANISKSVLLMRKIVQTGGIYFHFKTEEWPKEVAEMPTALCSFWFPELLGDYKLPIGEIKFSIVKTTRSSKVN